MNEPFSYHRLIALLLAFGILIYLIFKKKQEPKQNWGYFYSSFFSFASLPLVNIICESKSLWSFGHSQFQYFTIPADVFFSWIIIWAIVPLLFNKPQISLLAFLFLFWIDFLIIPHIAKHLNFALRENWARGNLLICFFVFIPGYFWAYFHIHDVSEKFRGIMQVITMILLFFYSLPILLFEFNFIDSLSFDFSSFEYQVLFIIAFPGLVGVQNLVSIGKGTAFPYDQTSELVRTGVYAYCKNPIQWSFTVIFLPLALIHQSSILLLGFVISLLYALSISDFQEYKSLKERFEADWVTYKKSVPKWYFSFRPRSIPKGFIYFDFTCTTCTQMKDWFAKKETTNLAIRPATEFNTCLSAVTYVDYLGNEYKSVKAIAFALGHINLAYASLGWFINFPLIRHVLQIIVDSIELNPNACDSLSDLESQ